MPVTSSIRIWLAASDYLSLDYAVASAQYEAQGERIKDRDGIVHRISPSAHRYPSWLTISLPASELTRLNNAGAGAPRSALTWLEQAYRAQAQLVVFVQGETIADDGSAITRKLAYAGRIDELSGDGLCSLPGGVSAGGSGGGGSARGGSDPGWVELRLHVSQDGAFTDLASLGSYSAYEPDRA